MAFKYRNLNMGQLQSPTLRNQNCKLEVSRVAILPDPDQTLREFYSGLPRVGLNEALYSAANWLMQAALDEKETVCLLDSDFIDAGLSPLLIHLINQGLIKTIAMTGRAAMRDFELSVVGQTDQDLRTGLSEGSFGISRETGEGMNLIINEGVRRGFGVGESLSRGILDRAPKYMRTSILAACAQKLVIPTVHVSIGADGFHLHPTADPMLLGKGSHKDLHNLSGRLEGLNEGGVLLACHRDQALRDAFHTALSVARNLGGVIDGVSLVRFGNTDGFAQVPGITAEIHLPGALELIFPTFIGQLMSLS